MATSPLSSQLQKRLLLQLNQNSNSKRNLLQKGFTLVELMIVIVIVGILSAVALPNFLNQTVKAKATECTTKLGGILTQVGAEHQLSVADAGTLFTTLTTDETTNSDLCTFSVTTAGTAAAPTYVAAVAGKGDLAGKYAANGCVQADTGKRDIQSDVDPAGAASAAAADCT